MNDGLRQSGRTTGRILETIGRALQAPRKAQEFQDHEPMEHEQMMLLKSSLEETITRLGLRQMHVQTFKGRLTVTSNFVGQPQRT